MILDCTQIGVYGYNLLSCLLCYDYLFSQTEELRANFYNYKLIPRNGSQLYKPTESYYPKHDNVTIATRICLGLSDHNCERWKTCCSAAMDCCDRHQKTTNTSSIPAEPYCRRTWDGWGCFDNTENGTTAEVQCPTYLADSNLNAKAIRVCYPNGSWYVHPNTGLMWTNYTSCKSVPDPWAKLYAGVITNGVSVMFLILAFGIFLYFRQLRREKRIRIHLHFFSSLIMSAVMFIVFEISVSLENSLSSHNSKVQRNTVCCKIIIFLVKYTSSATYFWMFCEALFIYNYTANAMKEPNRKMMVMYNFIGWGAPSIATSIWAIIRLSNKEYDYRCWIYQEMFDWIILAPNILCIFLNFIMLGRIFCVIVKLRDVPNEPNRLRGVLRATFFLPSLFGVHAVFAIYKPQTVNSEVWEIINRVLQGSQGTVVSILFCFCTSAFHKVLKRHKLFKRFCSNCLKNENNRKWSVSSAAITYTNIPPPSPIKSSWSEDIQAESSPLRSRVRFSLDESLHEVIEPEVTFLTKLDTTENLDDNTSPEK